MYSGFCILWVVKKKLQHITSLIAQDKIKEARDLSNELPADCPEKHRILSSFSLLSFIKKAFNLGLISWNTFFTNHKNVIEDLMSQIQVVTDELVYLAGEKKFHVTRVFLFPNKCGK